MKNMEKLHQSTVFERMYIFIDNILLELIILVTVDSDQFDQISFDFVLNIIDS